MNWIDYRQTIPFDFARTRIKDFPQSAIVSLSQEERTRAFELAAKIKWNPYVRGDQESFVNESKPVSSAFHPETIRFVQHELRYGFGAVLIKGLPTDENLPDTPTKGGSLDPDLKTSFINEAMLIAVGNITNAEPFNFRQEGRGMAPLLDNIVPVPKLKTQRGAGGYSNDFPFHCESAWHRKRPDYLILTGVRGAEDAKTLVFSCTQLRDSYCGQEISNRPDCYRLRAPDLYIQMEALGIPMGTSQYAHLPPVDLRKPGTRLNINFNGMDCKDEAAVNLLYQVEKFIEDNATGAILGPGTALILDNYRTCHTRTGYTPAFNGKDRWFIRGYFKNDLWAETCVRNGDQEGVDEVFFSAMVGTGWMDKHGRLTEEFSKFVADPQEITRLDHKMLDLASRAFLYTPVSGTRIV